MAEAGEDCDFTAPKLFLTFYPPQKIYSYFHTVMQCYTTYTKSHTLQTSTFWCKCTPCVKQNKNHNHHHCWTCQCKMENCGKERKPNVVLTWLQSSAVASASRSVALVTLPTHVMTKGARSRRSATKVRKADSISWPGPRRSACTCSDEAPPPELWANGGGALLLSISCEKKVSVATNFASQFAAPSGGGRR